jgi:hypothetical protein
MKRAVQGITLFLAAITFLFGGLWFFLGVSVLEVVGWRPVAELGPAGTVAMADNAYRFFAGIWLATGVGLLACLRDLTGQTVLFRTIMGALILSGVGRVLSAAQYGIVDTFVVPTLIELTIPTIALYLHAKLPKAA